MWYPQGEGHRRGTAVVASPMGCVYLYLDCREILQNGKFVQVSGGTVKGWKKPIASKKRATRAKQKWFTDECPSPLAVNFSVK